MAVILVSEVVEGETKRQIWGLRTAGEIFNLTGYTVSDVILTGADGIPVNTAGKFGTFSASVGQVYYDPASTDFVASKNPYRVRVKVTAGDATIRYFPNTKDPGQILVHPLR